MGEAVWREMIVLLSELDGPAQNWAMKTGGSLVIWDHNRCCRNIVIENRLDGISRKIQLGLFIRERSKGWMRQNIFFGCSAMAWKDVPGDRLLWHADIWEGAAPPSDYLECYAIYERAWAQLAKLTEKDLKPFGPIEGDAER